VTLLDRLERHLGRFAIPGLMRYIVILNALVYVLCAFEPSYRSMLVPDGAAIMRGEVWRLVSWIFVPNTQSVIWIFFYLMFTWWVGETLEATWGAFRLNVYYFLGLIGGSVAAVLFGVSLGNVFLIQSLLLALATLAPNFEIYFWFWPLKLKWVAMIGMIYPVIVILSGGWPLVILGFINYIIFFLPGLIRQRKHHKEVQSRRAKFEAAKLPESHTLHCCVVCGITEVTNPKADFRVADDDQEYCTDHLPRETAGTI